MEEGERLASDAHCVRASPISVGREWDARIESLSMGQGQQGSMHTKLRVAQHRVAQEDFQDLGACSGMQVP